MNPRNDPRLLRLTMATVEAGRRHWRRGADTVDIFAGGPTAENRDLAAKIHALGLPAIQQRSNP